MLLVFEEMRFALEREPDGLQAGRDKSDKDADLFHDILAIDIRHVNIHTHRDAALRRQAT